MDRSPLPPFTEETAAQKARLAEDAWNTRDQARVALAYTIDSRWCRIVLAGRGADLLDDEKVQRRILGDLALRRNWNRRPFQVQKSTSSLSLAS